MSKRRGWGLGTILAGTLVLGACGGGTPQPAAQQTPQPAAQQNPQPAAQAQPAAAAQPATPASAAPTPAAVATAAPAVLVQDHETGVEVTLVELKRTSGDSVTLKWRYRNGTAGPVKISKGGSSWLDAYQLTAGTFLIDPVNKKKYLVITDDQKYPLASKHGDWQGVTLEPGQTLASWAKLPAPPADVEKVAVTIPGVAPFENVPVVK